MSASPEQQTAQTIRDFGAQWTSFTANEGYYASRQMFDDIVQGLLPADAVQNARVADIGSGTGRIVGMLLAAGAQHVVAIEPSAAMQVLKNNLKDSSAKLTFVEDRGEAVGQFENLDMVVSIGVLHHIPEPAPVVAAAYKALRPGGKVLFWLYGKEGNETYLRFIEPLRKITQRLPDPALKVLCQGLNHVLTGYIFLCTKLPQGVPLPMRAYMNNMLGKLTPEQRYLTIYDQLNPAYAKYYTRDEAKYLVQDAGFDDVRLAHRHGYSWTVVGTKRQA